MDWWSVLFPKRCYGCGEVGSYLCSQCLNLMPVLNELFCPVCRRKSLNGQTHVYCLSRQSLNGLISVFAYKGITKKIILKLKYQWVTDLSELISELVFSQLDHPWFYTKEKKVVVPVPLHSQRLKWRGFNQAEMLAKPLAVNLGLAYEAKMLTRIKNTPPQMSLSRKERFTNLSGAFKADLSPKKWKRVLVVDDVATTGTTLNEAAASLKQAGAKEVWGFTLAQASWSN